MTRDGHELGVGAYDVTFCWLFDGQPAGMSSRSREVRVAASGQWLDADGVRLPTGEVHAWEPGHNQTVCGLPLGRSQLRSYAHVGWPDVQPATGGAADRVSRVCPRSSAAQGARRDDRPWNRRFPRP